VIALGIIFLLCLTALFAQYRHHVYRGVGLEPRIAALETKQSVAFDAKAFVELQSKVEALRIANDIKGRR
jgi:hypothetical protein